MEYSEIIMQPHSPPYITPTHTVYMYCILNVIDYNLIIILSFYSFYYLVKNMWYAEQKQFMAIKKGAAYQSRINTIT